MKKSSRLIAATPTLLPLAALFPALWTSWAIAASEGSYSVPVSESLRPYASFQLNSVQVKTSPGRISLSYELPEALTGVAGQLITFTGSTVQKQEDESFKNDESFNLSGPQGSASCMRSSAELNCLVHMQGIRTDSARLSQVLAAQSSSSEELAAREQVSAQFRSDPVGIVTYFY